MTNRDMLKIIQDAVDHAVADVLAGSGAARKAKPSERFYVQKSDDTPENSSLTPGKRLAVDAVEDAIERVLGRSRKRRAAIAQKSGLAAVREADLSSASRAVLAAARGTPQNATKSRPPTREEIEHIGGRNVAGADAIAAAMRCQRILAAGGKII